MQRFSHQDKHYTIYRYREGSFERCHVGMKLILNINWGSDPILNGWFLPLEFSQLNVIQKVFTSGKKKLHI